MKIYHNPRCSKSRETLKIILDNDIKPDIMRVISVVTNGAGVMPAYEGLLSDDEIKAVATYVAESTN